MVKRCTTFLDNNCISSTGANFSTTISTINPDSMSKVPMSTEPSNPLSLNSWGFFSKSNPFKSLKTWLSTASPNGFLTTLKISFLLQRVPFFLWKVMFFLKLSNIIQWSFMSRKAEQILIIQEIF